MVTLIALMLQVSKRLDATYGVRDQPGIACVLYWRNASSTRDAFSITYHRYLSYMICVIEETAVYGTDLLEFTLAQQSNIPSAFIWCFNLVYLLLLLLRK